jgi:hypothetical protein
VADENTGEVPRQDATAHPATVETNLSIGQPTVTGAAFFSVNATLTASGEVHPAPPMTTLGIEAEHTRAIRYSVGDKDGVRYVEVVDGDGQLVTSGMGEAADALTDMLLFLLPPDHPDFPPK